MMQKPSTIISINKIKDLLNGRLLEETLTYIESCHYCEHFVDGKCQKRDILQYHKLLAFGFCENWIDGEELPLITQYKKEKRIKLVFPTRILACGGAERWLVDLATSLDSTRFCVAVGIENAAKCDEILLTKLRSLKYLVLGRKNVQILLKYADAVLSWAYTPFTKAKLRILCSHGCDSLTQGILEEHKRVRTFYRIVSVSEKGSEIWKEEAKEIPIIWNGVDEKRLEVTKTKEQVRKELGVSKDAILIGFISRFIAAKHPERVYRVARRIRKAKAIFVGEVPKGERRIGAIYVERTEEIGNILNALDCFMLPSESEAFSLSIIEAWIAGIPVVTTSTGAIPELEAIFGPLVFRSEVEATDKETVLKAINESSEVVENAKSVALRYFTKKEMIKRWEQFLWEAWINCE